MIDYALVALGGAIGSVARIWLADLVDVSDAGGFPWGTMAVNVLGSFLIGAAAATDLLPDRWGISDHQRLFVMAGLCGGFTTFSSFSLQALTLLRDGFLVRGSAYIGLSVLACLAATLIAMLLVQALARG